MAPQVLTRFVEFRGNFKIAFISGEGTKKIDRDFFYLLIILVEFLSRSIFFTSCLFLPLFILYICYICQSCLHILGNSLNIKTKTFFLILNRFFFFFFEVNVLLNENFCSVSYRFNRYDSIKIRGNFSVS